VKQAKGVDYIILAIAVFVAALFLHDCETEESEECKQHRAWIDDTFNRVPKDDRQGEAINLTEFYKQCGDL